MGGALLPAPDAASDLWRTYTAAWHPVGVGSDTIAPPYLAVLGARAPLLGGAERAVDLLLLGGRPAGRADRLPGRPPAGATGPAADLGVPSTYALLPPVLGAVAAGRLGTAMLAVAAAAGRARGARAPSDSRHRRRGGRGRVRLGGSCCSRS